MGKDNSAQYPWFLISQTQKIGVLHVVTSDEDACKKIANQLLHRLPNLNLLSLLPYSTNVIGKPKCSWKPVVYQQQFYLLFRILIYCLCLPPLHLDLLPSCHRLSRPIKVRSKTLLSHLELDHSKNLNASHKKRK